MSIKEQAIEHLAAALYWLDKWSPTWERTDEFQKARYRDKARALHTELQDHVIGLLPDLLQERIRDYHGAHAKGSGRAFALRLAEDMEAFAYPPNEADVALVGEPEEEETDVSDTAIPTAL